MKRKAETSPEPVENDIQELTAAGDALISAIFERQPKESLDKLIKDAPLWYQNEEEEISCLHAAAYVQDVQLIRRLIERGAVWNAVDKLGNTAGDIALSFNNEECYTVLRDAGIRSELLLALLSSRSDSPVASAISLKATDTSAAGQTDTFLSSKLNFVKDANGQEICMVKAGKEEIGVMMGWERPIMESTVKKLKAGKTGPRILNIGFGLGIIDGLFQSLPNPPSEHVIIEAHPDVLDYMKENGWYCRQAVRVLEGKWQDILNSEDVGGFDIVYTDTFAEDYQQLHRFFECLPNLLCGPEARFSFFNGLGADNAVFYDVYTHLAELHLAEIGLDVTWVDIDVVERSEGDRWATTTKKYFSLPLYRLPIASLRAVPAVN